MFSKNACDNELVYKYDERKISIQQLGVFSSAKRVKKHAFNSEY